MKASKVLRGVFWTLPFVVAMAGRSRARLSDRGAVLL
jgi:hypothetical protein